MSSVVEPRSLHFTAVCNDANGDWTTAVHGGTQFRLYLQVPAASAVDCSPCSKQLSIAVDPIGHSHIVTTEQSDAKLGNEQLVNDCGIHSSKDDESAVVFCSQDLHP